MRFLCFGWLVVEVLVGVKFVFFFFLGWFWLIFFDVFRGLVDLDEGKVSCFRSLERINCVMWYAFEVDLSFADKVFHFYR